MHIPDGFISPKVYIPAYIVTSGLWLYSIRKLKSELNEETIPFIALLSAFSFILTLIMIPLPGGVTAHPLGIGLLSVVFGYITGFFVISIVFFIQAVFLGDGGITTLPINAFAVGILGGGSAYFTFKFLKRFGERFSLFLAGFISVVISSFFLALILGIQPIIAHDELGKPLFFPFGLNITIPAVLLPHLAVGLVEGIITVIGYNILRKIGK
ncbi:energy-coupling factor ABC transporter permease [Persephonella sp.]